MPTFRQLFSALDQERRTQLALTFWNAGPAGAQGDVLAALEKAFKFRRASLRKLPPERKANMLSSLAMNNELMASTLVRNYFLTSHREMLEEFLNLVGIPHDHGAYDRASVPEPPSADRLNEALNTLRAKYDPAIVNLYASVLRADDAELWTNLP